MPAQRRKRRKSRLNAKFGLETTTTLPRNNELPKPQLIKLADLFTGTDSLGPWFLKGRIGWARLLIVENPNPVPGGPTHAALIVERNSPALEPASSRRHDDERQWHEDEPP